MNLKYKCSVVYTTLPSLQKAEEIALSVIKNKLARCVNIIPGAISIYEWPLNGKGKIEKSEEFINIFKTISEKALMQFLKENHPYQTPAILSWDAQTNIPDFFTT